MVNRAFEAFIGRSRIELIGKRVSDTFPPLLAKRFEECNARVLASGLPERGEEVVPDARGRECWFVTLRFPLTDDSGAVQGVGLIASDVSDLRQVERQLVESDHRFRSLFENNPDPILWFDLTGNLVSINRAMKRFLGYTLAQLKGKRYRRLLPALAPGFGSPWPERSAPHTSEREVLDRQGNRKIVAITTVPNIVEGRLLGQYVVLVDRTEEKRSQATLRFLLQTSTVLSSSLDFRKTCQATADLTVPGLADWCVIDVCLPDDTIECVAVAHPDQGMCGPFRQARKEGAGGTALSRALVTGQPYHQEGLAADTAIDLLGCWPFAEPPPTAVLTVPMIVEERRVGAITLANSTRAFTPGEVTLAEELARRAALALNHSWLHQTAKHEALSDPLTGLPNRSLLMHRLGQRVNDPLRTRATCALLYIDLDRFKVLNDSLGHHLGDLVLLQSADRLRRLLRRGDVAARLGGDEFALLLDDVASAEEAAARAQEVVDAFRETFDADGYEVVVTPSIGVVLGAWSGEVKDLLHYADTAMNEVKRELGHGYAVFDERLLSNVGLERSLRLVVDDEPFFLELQPIVDLSGGRVKSVEALVRWEHPSEGVIPPGRFIPIAEETGLIVPIGRWVLQEACSVAKRLHSKLGVLWKISVNLSARQWAEPSAVEEIRQILDKTGLSPRLLQIEITESLLLSGTTASLDALRKLKELGVTLALDDFGTGYSALSYLQHLPIDVLKLDRSFLQDITFNRRSETLVKALIDLAHALGIIVTAEGVETAEQADMLKRFGCDQAQGYYVSKPLRPDQLERWLGARGNGEVSTRGSGSNGSTEVGSV